MWNHRARGTEDKMLQKDVLAKVCLQGSTSCQDEGSQQTNSALDFCLVQCDVFPCIWWLTEAGYGGLPLQSTNGKCSQTILSLEVISSVCQTWITSQILSFPTFTFHPHSSYRHWWIINILPLEVHFSINFYRTESDSMKKLFHLKNIDTCGKSLKRANFKVAWDLFLNI